MPPRGLAEIVLWVHDLQRSLAFYRDTLGLPVMSPPELRSPVFLRVDDGRWAIPQMLVLVQLPPGTPEFSKPRTLHHLALEVAPAEFDAEAARLTECGFKLRSGQHPVLPSRTLYLDDPDGNEVELICAAEA